MVTFFISTKLGPCAKYESIYIYLEFKLCLNYFITRPNVHSALFNGKKYNYMHLKVKEKQNKQHVFSNRAMYY